MKKNIIILTVIIITLILLIFGYFAYPVPGGDSEGYMPPVISYASGHGLNNYVDESTYLINQTHKTEQGRYFFYPPLYAITLAKIMWKPTTHVLFIVLGLINSLTLIISAYLIYKVATPKKRELSWLNTILIIFSLSALSTELVSRFDCRPEVLAAFIIIFSTLLITKLALHSLTAILGIMLGFMLGVHPFATVAFALLIGLIYSIQENYKTTFIYLFKTYTIAITTGFVLISLFSPYSILELFNGLKTYYKLVPLKYWKGHIIEYFLFDNRFTFYGAVFIFFIILSLVLLIKQKDKIKSKMFFFPFLFSLLIIFLILFKAPSRFYYIFMFMPIFIICIIYFVLNEYKEYKIRYLTILTILLFFLASIGFYRCVMLFPFYIKHGVSLERARELFNTIKNKERTNRFVIKASAFWTLTEDHKIITHWRPDINSKNDKILLFQQNYSSLLKPPFQVEKYNLIENYFVPFSPKVFGIKIANTVPGYAFAVYKYSNN